MKKCFSLTYLLLFFSAIVFAQNNSWELNKDESGIKIFTRQIEDSGFKEYRAEMTIASETPRIVTILKDVGRYKEWMTDIKEVELLKVDEDNLFYYAESLVPWPLDNRDMVYHLHFIKVNDTNVKIIVTGLSDYIPKKEGIVRIRKAIGFWELTLLEENKVQITYQLHVEPGGSIPAWLANSKVVDMPYYTLSGLRVMVNKK